MMAVTISSNLKPILQIILLTAPLTDAQLWRIQCSVKFKGSKAAYSRYADCQQLKTQKCRLPVLQLVHVLVLVVAFRFIVSSNVLLFGYSQVGSTYKTNRSVFCKDILPFFSPFLGWVARCQQQHEIAMSHCYDYCQQRGGCLCVLY